MSAESDEPAAYGRVTGLFLAAAYAILRHSGSGLHADGFSTSPLVELFDETTQQQTHLEDWKSFLKSNRCRD